MISSRSTFFEYGEVELEACDQITRQVSIKICIPACLMQAVTDVFLSYGKIDSPAIRNPIAAWIPTVDLLRCIPEIAQIPNLCAVMNEKINIKIREVLDIFKDISPALRDPSDLIPILPMGTYVRFRYRCEVDKLASALMVMEPIQVMGINEFRYALAKVLHDILESWS